MRTELPAVAANLVERWMELAGSHISFPQAEVDVACMLDNSRTGLLAAALELRRALAELPEGRQALSDLGFEPVAQHVEGE